jgi:predicted nucleic-acid-binding protein
VLGVDTNVLVRFLAKDDDVQTPHSAGVLTANGNHPIYVGRVVAAETFWVLTKVKKFPRQRVIDAFRGLLSSVDFKVEAEELMGRALDDCERVGCDFADALIALENKHAGCEATLTFDTDAYPLDDMVPLTSRLLR